MTELVERYRRNAEKCLRLVQNFNDPAAKRALLAMGNAWLILAAQREKNIEAAAATQPTPPINEPPKPPPIKEPPPVHESPQRLDAAKPDDLKRLNPMSALPPKADIRRARWDVR